MYIDTNVIYLLATISINLFVMNTFIFILIGILLLAVFAQQITFYNIMKEEREKNTKLLKRNDNLIKQYKQIMNKPKTDKNDN